MGQGGKGVAITSSGFWRETGTRLIDALSWPDSFGAPPVGLGLTELTSLLGSLRISQKPSCCGTKGGGGGERFRLKCQSGRV